jgi:hypothetical protein
VKTIFRTAESNLGVLNTVDLGPKRPFSVGEYALWARLTGPKFAAQVAAVASLVEAPANHRKATTVAKEAMAISDSRRNITVVDLEEAKRLAAQFEALGGGALAMALTQGTEPGGALARVLARTRAVPRVGGPLGQPRGNVNGPHGQYS